MATLEAGITQRNTSTGAWRTEGPVNRVTWYLRSPKTNPHASNNSPSYANFAGTNLADLGADFHKGPEPGQMAAKQATPGSNEDCAVKGFYMEPWNVRKLGFVRVQLTTQPVS